MHEYELNTYLKTLACKKGNVTKWALSQKYIVALYSKKWN